MHKKKSAHKNKPSSFVLKKKAVRLYVEVLRVKKSAREVWPLSLFNSIQYRCDGQSRYNVMVRMWCDLSSAILITIGKLGDRKTGP
jgi:hypothetical protein